MANQDDLYTARRERAMECRTAGGIPRDGQPLLPACFPYNYMRLQNA